MPNYKVVLRNKVTEELESFYIGGQAKIIYKPNEVTHSHPEILNRLGLGIFYYETDLNYLELEFLGYKYIEIWEIDVIDDLGKPKNVSSLLADSASIEDLCNPFYFTTIDEISDKNKVAITKHAKAIKLLKRVK